MFFSQCCFLVFFEFSCERSYSVEYIRIENAQYLGTIFKFQIRFLSKLGIFNKSNNKFVLKVLNALFLDHNSLNKTIILRTTLIHFGNNENK